MATHDPGGDGAAGPLRRLRDWVGGAPGGEPAASAPAVAANGDPGAGLRLQTPDQPGSQPARCAARVALLRRWIAPGSVGAELGVFKGAFIDHLLTTDLGTLYCVDPWHRLEPEWNWARGDRSTSAALAAILTAFRPEIHAGRVIPRVEFSVEFMERMGPASLDWIYLDTSHRYDDTRAELAAALVAVKPGGAIMGDDFYTDPSSIHHGVCKAVREMEAEGAFALEVAGEQWQFVARVPGG